MICKRCQESCRPVRGSERTDRNITSEQTAEAAVSLYGRDRYITTFERLCNTAIRVVPQRFAPLSLKGDRAFFIFSGRFS